MDFNEVLFRRMLVKPYKDPQNDEEKNRIAEEVFVTKEQNGYALWYRGGNVWPGQIIAWTFAGGRDDILSLAARITLDFVYSAIEEGYVTFKVQRLCDLAEEPQPEPQAS
jgi:hypothetical protein